MMSLGALTCSPTWPVVPASRLGHRKRPHWRMSQPLCSPLWSAVFCCCQEAGRRMLSAGKGSIINITSIAGLTALGRSHAPYSMAMGGTAQMT